jgi:hypothetical protein
MTSNILNCKQFRASEDPDKYCYQALTMGAMRFTKFNGMGLLGEQAVMAGDMSGGYSIKLHEWPSIPITRLLGLEVEKRWRGDGVNVAQLKPVMSYWYDCNMDYMTGYNVAWRTRDAIWHDRDGKTYPPKIVKGSVPGEERLYNSTLGSSAKPIAGPFRFSGTTIRVMPLLARRAKIDAYLDEYLNTPLAPAGERFCLWAPVIDTELATVYLTATSFGDVTSGTNNVGDWADREMAFLIPVKREREVAEGTWELVGVGLVPAYTYVDNVTAAISGARCSAFRPRALGSTKPRARGCRRKVPQSIRSRHYCSSTRKSFQPLVKASARRSAESSRSCRARPSRRLIPWPGASPATAGARCCGRSSLASTRRKSAAGSTCVTRARSDCHCWAIACRSTSSR